MIIMKLQNKSFKDYFPFSVHAGEASLSQTDPQQEDILLLYLSDWVDVPHWSPE